MLMHMPIDCIEKSDHRHPPFGEAYRPFLERMARLFADTCPGTPEEWEDDFRRDSNPEREMEMWQHLADCYEHFLAEGEWGEGRKGELFGVLMCCLGEGEKAALRVKVQHLARPFVKRVVAHATRVTGGKTWPVVVSLD